MKTLKTILLKILSIPLYLVNGIATLSKSYHMQDRRNMQKSIWWAIILIVGPVLMGWNTCSLRPIVKKKQALENIGVTNVNSLTEKEINYYYDKYFSEKN